LRIEDGSEDRSCRDVGDNVARKTDRERGGDQGDANPEKWVNQVDVGWDRDTDAN